MKHLHLLFIAAIVYLVSCTGNDKKTTPPDQQGTSADTLTEVMEDSTALSAETIDTFSTMAFSEYAKKKSPGFDWTRFRLTQTWTEDSMVTAPFRPDKQFYESYGPFVKYSPDSTRFIDLDSYNLEIRKDAKGGYFGSEMGPDLEVSLVNLQTGIKTRLLFMGPGNSIEDGLWLDNETVALVGINTHENENGKTAAVWKINLPTNTYWLYELDDTAAARELFGYWRNERLKGVEFNDHRH